MNIIFIKKICFLNYVIPNQIIKILKQNLKLLKLNLN